MKFSTWLNSTNMNSFRAFVLTIIASIILVFFTAISGTLMMDRTSASSALNHDPGIRAAAQTTETSHHSYGMQLATAVLALLGAALGLGVAATYGDRVTAKEHTEAKERGRMAGLAIARSMGLDSQPPLTTTEMPAVQIEQTTKLNGDDNGGIRNGE
jgi:hypothetical protein